MDCHHFPLIPRWRPALRSPTEEKATGGDNRKWAKSSRERGEWDNLDYDVHWYPLFSAGSWPSLTHNLVLLSAVTLPLSKLRCSTWPGQWFAVWVTEWLWHGSGICNRLKFPKQLWFAVTFGHHWPYSLFPAFFRLSFWAPTEMPENLQHKLLSSHNLWIILSLCFCQLIEELCLYESI